MIQLIANKFQSLAAKERKQIIFLLASSLLAGYFFWAASVWQGLFDARKFADRRANRIELKVGDVNPPELKSEVSEKRLKSLQAQLTAKEQQLETFVSKLLPVDNRLALENHKLDITRLAESQGLEIGNFTSGFSKAASKSSGNSLQALKNRPRFKLEAQGGYFQLIGFLDGLNQLTYLTRVENLALSRGDHQLNIHFELQM